jgi:exodeoxyribonuclease-3
MKIISYNLNGIRSAMTKGLVDFMQAQKADVYCFQEVKATSDQVQSFLFIEDQQAQAKTQSI